MIKPARNPIQSSSPAQRRITSKESFKSVGECVGEVSKGMALFAITRGQFSMIDVVLYLTKNIGISQLSLWTWAIADYEVEVVEKLLDMGEILDSVLIVDYSASKRNLGILNRWRERFGEDKVKVCMNHAKIARIWNDDYKFLVRGSMNLNFNPRFEQLDLTEGGEEFNLVERIESEIPVLKREHSKLEARDASSLRSVFTDDTLNTFFVVNEWKP